MKLELYRDISKKYSDI